MTDTDFPSVAEDAPEPPADPRPFQLRGDPPSVMRLSRRALTVLGVAAGLGIGGSLIYALTPAGERQTEELYNTEGRATAETIPSGPSDYAQAPRLGPPLPGDLGGPILSAQQRGEEVPVPPIGGETVQADPAAQAREAAMQRAQQERDAARTSSVFLSGSGAGYPQQVSPGGALDLASLQAAQSSSASNQTTTPGGGFMSRPTNRETVSAERLRAPASPNIVQAGSIIPAALITGIRSDLPGQITAQVTQNVYDSPTGRILLIPQGARLIGEYDSQIDAGQSRVLLAWDRLILPDGRSITLERQSATDASGYTGLQDRVNQHWGRLLRAAAISTLLGVGTELGGDSDDDLIRALRRGSQDTINQTGQQVVGRQLNVQPTLTIRPGHPLRVLITRDLILEPIGTPR